MGIESAPKQKNAKEQEWAAIQKDWADALAALDPASKRSDELGKLTESSSNTSLNAPVMDISSKGTLEEVEGYLQANASVLSEPQRNFLLCSLRVKKFKRDNNLT